MEFDFSKEYSDLGSVPTQFQCLFGQDGGAGPFKLKVTPETKGAVEAIVGLNRALKAERNTSTELKRGKVDLAPLAAFGDDPTTIAAAIEAKIKELEAGTKNKVDLEKVRADMAKAHGLELEKREARITGLTGQLHSVLVSNEAMKAIGDARPVDVDLVMPFVLKSIGVSEEDGSIKVFVKDEQGNRRYGATGNDLTITELVGEMRASPKFKPLFISDQKPGTGHPAGASRTIPKGGVPIAGASGTEKTSLEKISSGLGRLNRPGQRVGSNTPDGL